MGRQITYRLVVAAILLAPTVIAQDATNSALIQGIVSRMTNGQPVEGVTVTAVSDSGSKYAVTTDNSGTFTFKGIPAGRYTLSASRSGFLPYDSEKHSTGVSVLPGQQLRELRIQLTPEGLIAGRVLDSNHQPVVGAAVMAIRPIVVNGRQVLAPDLAFTGYFLPMGSRVIPTWEYPKAVTDDQGQYRIFGLAPGEYYVSVWSAGAETLEEATGGINKTPGYTKDQPPMYYPGVVDPGASVAVSVNGNDRQGIDLELRRETLHRFRFQVVSSIPPEPCRGIGDAQESIVLIRHSEKLDVIQYSSRFGNTVFKKGADDEWTSPLLPAGSYEIFFNPCMFDSFRMVGSLTTNVVDRDVDAGKLIVPLNANVSGHMEKTEAPSVNFKKLQLRLRPLDLRSASTSMIPRVAIWMEDNERVQVRKDGTFALGTASPGHYQIDVAGLPEDVYVASIKFGGREVRDTGLRVDGDSSSPLEISLAQQGGVVDGVVKDRSGKPVVDSFVALMPLRRELVYSNLFRETRTGQDGSFIIRGIPPGEYEIVAVENLNVGESRSAEFREGFRSRLFKITVKQGSLETLSLIVASR